MLDILLYSEDTELSQLISSYLLEQNKHFRILHVLSEEADLITFLQKSHFAFREYKIPISQNIKYILDST